MHHPFDTCDRAQDPIEYIYFQSSIAAQSRFISYYNRRQAQSLLYTNMITKRLARHFSINSNLKILTTLKRASSIKYKPHPDNPEIAIISLDAKPTNALSKNTLRELENIITKLETEKLNNTHIRGLILTSSVPGIFSAGLDIFEFYDKPVEDVEQFYKQVQNTFIKLYSTKLVTIAAINGTSPAGGCLLAIACDYRLMARHPKFQIGLNQVDRIGLCPQKWYFRQ